MSKETIKKICVLIIVFIGISILTFSIDFAKVLNQKEPLFSIKKAVYEYGGTVEYMGLGYKIFRIKRINWSMDEIKVGNIFSSYETIIGDE